MDDVAGTLVDTLVRADAALEREFADGLAEWSSLAFRVAYSVLRHREDAEDIAQDVLARAAPSTSSGSVFATPSPHLRRCRPPRT